MIYEYYKVDGTKEKIECKEPLSLERLQSLVGGYIELVRIGAYAFMVNEEGLLQGLKPNPFYPQFVGNIVKGKTKGSNFVGLSKVIASGR